MMLPNAPEWDRGAPENLLRIEVGKLTSLIVKVRGYISFSVAQGLIEFWGGVRLK